jgi:hypothetical protein
MFLLTDATPVAQFACAKTQAVRGANQYRKILFVPAILVASMLAVAPFSAQIVDRIVLVTPATFIFINPVNSSQEDSLGPNGVSFSDSVPPQEVNQLDSFSALPEAPGAMMQDQSLRASMPMVTRTVIPASARVVPITMMHVPAGWAAQPLTARNKIEMGARELYSPFSMLGYLVTAGYEQAGNGQPNYGTNARAFGQRLGATVLRDSTESALTDIVFAPLLREDPRYFVEGPQHGFIHRVVYAATRPLLTRTDSGRETVNGAELLGYASASALSYTFYPAINQNFHDTAATFGGSLAGSALGDLVLEFSGQLLGALHLKKNQ